MKYIKTTSLLSVLFIMPKMAWAFDDVLENAVNWLTGPLGLLIGIMGLACSAILYIFGGNNNLGKVIASAIGSLILLSAPRILSTIQTFVN